MSPQVTQTEIEMLLGEDSTDQGIGETLGLLRESMPRFIQTFEAITGVAVHRGDGEALIRVNPEGNATVVDGTYEKTIRLRGVHPTHEITAWYTELLNDIETVEDTETMRTFDTGVRCVASQWADPVSADVEREQMELYQLGDDVPVTKLSMGAELITGGDVTFEPIEPPQKPRSVGGVDPASYVEDQYQAYNPTTRDSDSTVEITVSGESDTAAHTVDFETEMYMRSQSDGDDTRVAEVIDYEPADTHERVTLTLVLPNGSTGEVVGRVGAEESDCADGEVPFETLCDNLYNPSEDAYVDLEHVGRLVGAVGAVHEGDECAYVLDVRGEHRHNLAESVTESDSSGPATTFEPSNNIEAAMLAVWRGLRYEYSVARILAVVVLLVVGIAAVSSLLLGL